jgi:scyllo-inositol 2-dehydrogenase (NADP+)
MSRGVAIVGYGYATRTFHAPLIAAVAGLSLRCIISSDAAKVHADWPEVAVVGNNGDAVRRDDVELIVIASPNQTHFPLCREALEAGKDVVVDKPFTVTVAEADELVALAARQQRMLAVFHNRRWDSDFLTVRRVLENNMLGPVVHFESHYDRFRPVPKTGWREHDAPGSGVWFDLGSHLGDQALQLFGTPQAVYADFETQRPDGRATDYFHVLLRYDRLRVILHGASVVAAESPRFVVHGMQGSFIKYGLDAQEAALLRRERPGGEGWGVDPRPATVVTPDSRGGLLASPVPSVPGNYLSFYEAIAAGQNPVPGEQAANTMRLIELAQKSAEQRRELAWNDPVVPSSC